MPYIAEKFQDYNSFASSRLMDILPADKVQEGVVNEINSFNSIILYNEGNEGLRKVDLPNEAQISPLKSCLILDINEDGIKDLITIGNHFGVEVETTRYDAGYGAVFLGNPNGDYTFSPPQLSGFYSPDDGRGLLGLKTKTRDYVVVLNNDSRVQVFQIN